MTRRGDGGQWLRKAILRAGERIPLHDEDAVYAAEVENTLKFAVGVMLTAFGSLWAAEGVGVDWPGGDGALIGLILVTLAWPVGFVRLMRAPVEAPACGERCGLGSSLLSATTRSLRSGSR